MILIDTILYYLFFASSVLVYGIGLTRVGEIGFIRNSTFTYYTKIIIGVFISSILGWLLTQYVLAPIGIIELFPLFVLLIYICINTFLEALVKITTNQNCSEFVVSYLIVILSILESTSLINTIIICVSCFMSILLLFPIIYAFKKRVYSHGKNVNESYYSIFFIFLAIVVLVLSVWDVAWINPEVIK